MATKANVCPNSDRCIWTLSKHLRSRSGTRNNDSTVATVPSAYQINILRIFGPRPAFVRKEQCTGDVCHKPLLYPVLRITQSRSRGPTGSGKSIHFLALSLDSLWLGKTLLARTLANVIDVPFSINDATSFTQVLRFAVKGTTDS